MKNFIVKIIFAVIIIAGITYGITWFLKTNSNKEKQKKEKQVEKEINKETNKDKKDNKNLNDLDMVPVLKEKIKENAVWAGTTNLVWNEMLDKLNDGKAVEVEPKSELTDHLNKKGFTKEMVPDSYYYIKADKMKEGLKEEIEKEIKDKFNQKSNILDQIDWSVDENKYLFYSMLYREFEFKNKFNKLENGKFKEYKNVKYFGTEGQNEEKLKEQIDILYYKNDNDFALAINTKDGDQVVVNKNPKGDSFYDIYKNILKNKMEYENDPKAEQISDNYLFKMPNIDFKKIKTYDELENVTIKAKDNFKMRIEKVLQGIEFKLDEKGGRVKSETAMRMIGALADEKMPKELYIDDTFALFIQKENKVPFFALKIDDISLVQNGVNR